MMRLLFGLSTLAVSFGGLSGCNSNNGCEGVSCVPLVAIVLEHSLSESGSYEIDFVADGTMMKCTIALPSTAPANCTDSRAYVVQKSGQGITSMSVDGTYKTLSVTVKHEGETIASETFSPLHYQSADFTGVGCVSCPSASVTLKVGEGPDASSKPAPDASVVTKPDASAVVASDASSQGRPDAADAH